MREERGLVYRTVVDVDCLFSSTCCASISAALVALGIHLHKSLSFHYLHNREFEITQVKLKPFLSALLALSSSGRLLHISSPIVNLCDTLYTYPDTPDIGAHLLDLTECRDSSDDFVLAYLGGSGRRRREGWMPRRKSRERAGSSGI